jgi:hypothetical protein
VNARGVMRRAGGVAAVVLAAAWAWDRARRTRRRRALAREREWISDLQPGPDGRPTPDRLIDKALADTFPASDPPSFRAYGRTGGWVDPAADRADASGRRG